MASKLMKYEIWILIKLQDSENSCRRIEEEISEAKANWRGFACDCNLKNEIVLYSEKKLVRIMRWMNVPYNSLIV